MPEVAWAPQPRQQRALTCDIYELFYGGAKGGGKSDFLLMDFLGGLEHGSAWNGVLFRRSYPELEELQKRARELYPQVGGLYKKTERTWYFDGGANLKMRHLERDDDVHSYQGHQYQWVGFDELTNWASPYCYIYMHSCARSAAGTPIYIRASGNPGSKGHAWVKARFVDVAPPETPYLDPDTRLSRVYIPAKLDDNPALSENDPQYIQRLRMLPEHLQRAYIDGDWNIFAGQFFDEFRVQRHMCKPIRLEPDWSRFAALDWGYAKPYSIGFYAVTPRGRLYRFKEMYGCEHNKPNVGVRRSAEDVAQEAWEYGAAMGATEMVADPSIWKDEGTGRVISDIFTSVGWEMYKGNNNRHGGWQLLHDHLKQVDDDGFPLLRTFNSCTNYSRLIPAMVTDEKDAEDIDTDQEDHLADEVRYAVTSDLAKRTHRVQTRDIATTESAKVKTFDPLNWGKSWGESNSMLD